MPKEQAKKQVFNGGRKRKFEPKLNKKNCFYFGNLLNSTKRNEYNI